MSVQRLRAVEVTPTCHAGEVTADEMLFQHTAIPNATNRNGGASMLKSVVLHDKDDVGGAVDLYFFEKNTTELGALSGAVTISDADLDAINPLGWVTVPAVAAGAIGDLVNGRVLLAKDVNLPVISSSDTRTIYVSARVQSTATYTAAGIDITFVFED